MNREMAGNIIENLKIHWKAPLQTKGFLRIIEFFLAILAFSLVAGFSLNGSVVCQESSEPITFHFKYPFSTYSYTNMSEHVVENLQYRLANGASQLFVAWGVLSMLYCIIALLVYMLFTANEQLEKVVDALVYTDLVFTIGWVLCWFIACVDWTVAYRGLVSYLDNELLVNFTQPQLANCPGGSNIVEHSLDTAEQAAIGSVFGFLNLAVWSASIYWVFIDTAFFIKWRARRQNHNYENI